MKPELNIHDADIDFLLAKLNRDAEAGGYHLNPDLSFTRDLVRSLLINEQRFGYPACPCRLASSDRRQDLDIICPCDYRDPDLSEFGTCYCGLYVSEEVKTGIKSLTSIPDRRPLRMQDPAPRPAAAEKISALAYPIWRCKVCGYLCAREQPPETCPICRARSDRFERML